MHFFLDASALIIWTTWKRENWVSTSTMFETLPRRCFTNCWMPQTAPNRLKATNTTSPFKTFRFWKENEIHLKHLFLISALLTEHQFAVGSQGRNLSTLVFQYAIVLLSPRGRSIWLALLYESVNKNLFGSKCEANIHCCWCVEKSSRFWGRLRWFK